MISVGRRVTPVIVAVSMMVVSCSSEVADGAECESVVTDLIVATQEFVDALGERTWEEAPFTSSAETWISEYSDTHFERTRLFVSLDHTVSQADLEALASDVKQMDGVQTVRALNQEEALAETSVLFADQPEVLEHIAADLNAVPASLRVAVAPESASEVTGQLETRSQVVEIIEDPVSIDDLAYGVAVLDLPQPAFDEPMERAASLGCTEEVLLAEMRERSEELVAQGTAGDSFITSVKGN